MAPNARGKEGGGNEGVSTYLPGALGVVEEDSEIVDDAELDGFADSWNARLVVANPAALTAAQVSFCHAREEVAEDEPRAPTAVRAIDRCTPIFGRMVISEETFVDTIWYLQLLTISLFSLWLGP